MVSEPCARLRLASGRGVDIDERPCERYRIHASSSVRVSVRESRYLTMTGVASDRPHSGPLPPATLRARHDDGAFGNDQRPIGSRFDDLAAHEIGRRRSGQHRAGADDRAGSDDGAFVNTRVAAHQRVVLDDDGKSADRLDDAADLCARAHVHARRRPGARPDERMRVDERLLANPRADVDEHRRHADDSGPMCAPSRTDGRRGRCVSRHRGEQLERQRVLVVEGPAAMIHRRVDGFTEAEAEENSLLHPRVHAPANRARRVGFGGAHRA